MASEFEVAVYNSFDSESDLETGGTDPETIRRRAGKTWIFKQTFENPTEAKNWIEQQKNLVSASFIRNRSGT
jgi:hypothetical protein